MPQTRDIVVIGGSVGALDALRTILRALPDGFSASVFVVLHTAAESPGILASILARASQLPVTYATDREQFHPGHVYLAPADRHLLVKSDHIRLTTGPRENRFRPAVDPLFRTAAVAHGPRVIGVVLSGHLDDGAIGLAMIKNRGGSAIVQDPFDAQAPSMPQTALRQVSADYVAAADDIAPILERLVSEPLALKEDFMPDRDQPDISETGSDAIHHSENLGTPSPFTCPECGGALWEYQNGQLLQFRCHIGHRFGGESLLSAQTEGLDHALWAGLRALEESAELRRRMANHARDRGMQKISEDYDEAALESETRARLIRRVLMPESGDIQAEPVGAGRNGRRRKR